MDASYEEQPFSVISGRTGRWQKRNKEWKALGIESELGREQNLTYHHESMENYAGFVKMSNTSIFSPTLCEVAYGWFSAPGDKILDPFAGGSVRGIVASKMGREYTGIDLSLRQVSANIQNARDIETVTPIHWICGDSCNLSDICINDMYDFVFTCPPYGNLEKYSDDPHDLSAMTNNDFDITYRNILHQACSKLKDNRFMAIVVGNYRNSKGFLRDLVGLTVDSMEECGVHYYDDFIYMTPIANIRFTAKNHFRASRKFGRTHQYMLVFVKGDPKKASQRLEI